MLVELDFAVTQMAYVKAAMDQIAAFRPDGETPALVLARLNSATPVRSAYVTQKEAVGAARALRHATIDAVHDGAVDFAAQGRSRFRKNPQLAERFAALPVQDQTFQETLVRADTSVALWGHLPLVGTPPAAFTVGQGTGALPLAGFTALLAAARAADGAMPAADEAAQAAEADVHVKLAEFGDFVTAALEQGRSQFAAGSPEREIIDAVPLVNSTGGGGSPPPPPPPPVAPAAAVLGGVTVGNDGLARLSGLSAVGAVSFTVELQGPGEAAFSAVATGQTSGFDFATLPAGDYLVRIFGVNAVGPGPASAALPFTIP